MVYDSFIFFNEIELLHLRLHELSEVVDRFVLVESTRTFTNRPKPLLFAQNREAFAAFADKIIHVVVEDSPDAANPWRIEDFQRNCIRRGLKNCRPDDIVMVSDVDEIPAARQVRQTVSAMRFSPGLPAALAHRLFTQFPIPKLARNLFKKWHPFVYVFEQRVRQFYFNGVPKRATPWWGTRMAYYRDVGSPNDLRCWKGHAVPDGGWHFTYLGGVERIQAKLAAFSHQEFNTPQYNDAQRLTENLQQGRDFLHAGAAIEFEPLDATYPDYLLRNQQRFQPWIRPER